MNRIVLFVFHLDFKARKTKIYHRLFYFSCVPRVLSFPTSCTFLLVNCVDAGCNSLPRLSDRLDFHVDFHVALIDIVSKVDFAAKVTTVLV